MWELASPNLKGKKMSTKEVLLFMFVGLILVLWCFRPVSRSQTFSYKGSSEGLTEIVRENPKLLKGASNISFQYNGPVDNLNKLLTKNPELLHLY
jgi:hypothetical protein